MPKRLLFPTFFLFLQFHLSAQSIEETIAAYMSDFEMMGMSAIVMCDNEIIYAGNYGTADFARDIPVTDSTLYRIASISKSVTAAGFMKLVEDGFVSLDANIADILGFPLYNPNFPEIPITPKMLLSHTSCIIDGSGYDDFLAATYNNENPPAINELLASDGDYYSSDIYLNKMPGNYFSYSNLNYGILGTLIEKISGVRFDIFMREQLLLPLNMVGSFNIQDITNINNIAVLYRKPGPVWVPQADDYDGIMPTATDYSGYMIGTNDLIFAPQGGLRASADDLSHFMQMLTNYGNYNGNQILDSATVAMMRTPEWVYSGTNGNNYGGLFNA
jgi:CubicO group peptidase (beta-lactamase class C family)